MKNQFVTGIGCFAQPEKLSRIFLRMLRTCMSGRMDEIDLVNECLWVEPESTELIKALIAGKATHLDSPGRNTAKRVENEKITGFFLTLKDHSLELSIFSRNRHRRLERHSASLFFRHMTAFAARGAGGCETFRQHATRHFQFLIL